MGVRAGVTPVGRSSSLRFEVNPCSSNLHVLSAPTNKKSPISKRTDFFSTLDGTVLELLYKDMAELYKLKEPLKAEGLSDYKESTQYIRDNRNNSLLHIRT